jgi:hypothetical protein
MDAPNNPTPHDSIVPLFQRLTNGFSRQKSGLCLGEMNVRLEGAIRAGATPMECQR